ncbi:hypothetical protein PVAND_014780 [Polypedilum vanderplanki]|uniref:Zinc finger protein n=1 Tax=Polypedilum vanderplanki TaxID=319348 RepID=A0A9J6BAQ1_POLVA|nr:hypothetical protein PVAND_014780 [Polypedilum vanderplanki]
MQSLCRICRKDCLRPSSSIEISSIHEGVLIHEMLSKTCPIDIDDPITQLFPQKVCHECLEVLTAAYNLQRVSVESDQYFRQMIFSDKLVVKSEKDVENLVKEEEIDIIDDDSMPYEEPEIEMETENIAYIVPLPKVSKKSSINFNPRIVAESSASFDPFYECNFCQIQLKPRSNMLKHLKHEHDPILLPYNCNYCPARFKSDHKRELHESIQHDDENEISVFICEYCGVNGVSKEGMRHHLIDDHDIRDNRKLKIQDLFNFSPRPCNKAQKYEDIIYACNFCDVKLKPRQNLIRHMQRKHDPKVLPYYCKKCPLRFKDAEKRATHVTTHEPDEPKIFICELCTVTGTRENGMLQHKMDDHGVQIEGEISSQIFNVEENVAVKKKSSEIFHPRPADGSWSIGFEDTSYACNFCDQKIKPKSRMLYHMRSHNPQLFPHACKLCISRFKTTNELSTHMRLLHDENDEPNILTCDLCGVTGTNKEGMENHMTDDHLLIPFRPSKRGHSEIYRCTLCSAKFMQKKSLDNHMLARHRETTKCDSCDAEFTTKRDMSNHVMQVHCKLFREVEPHEITVNLKCIKCEEEYSSYEQLIEHVMGHKQSFKTEKTKCHFCPRNLKNYHDFLEHAKYHAQPCTHECLTCKKRYPFDDKLFSHVKNHKRYDCYKVECKKCKQKFRSAKDLEIHDKVKHNKETLFICPICAKSMSSANGLDQHIRYVHNKDQEKKFQCKSCPMKFILKTKLIRHEAIHSTERPHVCEICGNSFKHSEGLNLHMKRHNGTLERKHACNQCNHRFTTKHRLEQHMMTHTGLKPHECKFCDRAYASKGDLVKHMQKLHVGDAIYQCDKCPRAFRLIVELREHQSEHATY